MGDLADGTAIKIREYDKRIAELEQRVEVLEAALTDAIDGYEEGAQYKGEYLFNKHGDAEEIARLRAVREGGKRDA